MNREMNATGTVEVIEWPQEGAAKRGHGCGWWVVVNRPGRGFTPLKGPFSTRLEADYARDALPRQRYHMIPEEREKVCPHAMGFPFWGTVPCTGEQRCPMCGTRKEDV